MPRVLDADAMTERYLDINGVAFDEVPGILGPRKKWPKKEPIEANGKERWNLFNNFHSQFDDDGCWLCGTVKEWQLSI